MGTLAQLVEQRTFNPLVTSSNLVRPTKNLVMNQALSAEMPRCFFISGRFWTCLVTIHVTISMMRCEAGLLSDEIG